jgi:uncharacterized RDD family membrane protein YckC
VTKRRSGRSHKPAGGVKERSPQFVLAGNGRRLVGAYVDGLVGAAIGFGVFRVVLSFTHGGVTARVVGVLITAVYLVPSVALSGRTVGKVVAGTRVALRDGGGARPGWWRAAVRWAVPSALGLGFLVVLGGPKMTMGLRLLALGWEVVVYGAILTNPLRQGLHDRAAGTIVVRHEPRQCTRHQAERAELSHPGCVIREGSHPHR